MLRASGEAKLRGARRLEREAWNARLFYGGSAQPSPTIADAIEMPASVVSKPAVIRATGSTPWLPPYSARRSETELCKLEASLVCEHSRAETGRRAQPYIIGVAETDGPEAPLSKPNAAVKNCSR
jgi:hypothetical protein